MPSLVMEFIETIRQSAPHKRGDRVDHHPEFVFGALHFELFLSLELLQGRRRSSARAASSVL
jgi:hypothetical protein